MPGWQWLWHAEIEAFPSAVMAARHPGSVNLGDVSAPDFVERALHVGRPDIVVFGSPCQSFSVAGKRLGLTDPRGNLALTALALVRRIRPRWFCFENVPGLLSSERGRDFDAFLSAVAECGYLGCWRVLDAQHFGVPQRRRRIFFVGYLGDWRPAAAVLSLIEGMSGHPAPRDEARQAVAGSLGAGSKRSGGRIGRREAAAGHLQAFALDLENLGSGGNLGWRDAADTSICVNTRGNIGIARSLRADGFDASEDGTGRGTPLVIAPPVTSNPYGDHESREGLLVPVAFLPNDPGSHNDATAPSLRAGSGGGSLGSRTAIAFSCKDSGLDAGDIAPTLRAMPHDGSHANAGGQVAIAMNLRGRDGGAMPECDDLASVRAASGGSSRSSRSYVAGWVPETYPTWPSNEGGTLTQVPPIATNSAVRRLTPRECERLQGFPDDWTLIKYRGKDAADGPRYKACGNSMAVPVLRWLLSRIEQCDAALSRERAAA